ADGLDRDVRVHPRADEERECEHRAEGNLRTRRGVQTVTVTGEVRGEIPRRVVWGRDDLVDRQRAHDPVRQDTLAQWNARALAARHVRRAVEGPGTPGGRVRHVLADT